LEPSACPTHEDHHEVERTIFGEIVQMKKDRTVPVFRCMVIESVMSQYCRFNSAGVVVRYITFREPRRGEAQECRATKEKGKMSVGGQEFKVTHPWHNHLPLHLPAWGPHRRELLRDWRAGGVRQA
jgi:hypothetical protein